MLKYDAKGDTVEEIVEKLKMAHVALSPPRA
jgi:hypothetical protein